MSNMFYNGVRMYSRLHAVQRAAKGGLAFGIGRGSSMSFVSFDSLEEFERWYLRLSPDMRMLNEVVTSDTRKFMLDIDHPSADILDRLLLLDFERHVTSRIHEVFFTLGLGRPDVVFYTMCSDTKISYHVVVSNFVFSARTCAGLCMIVCSGQVWGGCADMGVYKKVQFVRVEGSTKFGERRWKERLTVPGPLRQGLLSDTDKTREPGLVIDTFYPTHGYGQLVRSSGIARSLSFRTKGLQEETERSLHKLIYGKFRIGSRLSNGVVPLYRIKPDMCIQCNRVHDRENAYIKYVMGSPVFVCWRHHQKR